MEHSSGLYKMYTTSQAGDKFNNMSLKLEQSIIVFPPQIRNL
jgi:hypothetical protein